MCFDLVDCVGKPLAGVAVDPSAHCLALDASFSGPIVPVNMVIRSWTSFIARQPEANLSPHRPKAVRAIPQAKSHLILIEGTCRSDLSPSRGLSSSNKQVVGKISCLACFCIAQQHSSTTDRQGAFKVCNSAWGPHQLITSTQVL